MIYTRKKMNRIPIVQQCASYSDIVYTLYTFIILKSGERRLRWPRNENVEQSAKDENKNKQLSARNGHDGFHTNIDEIKTKK